MTDIFSEFFFFSKKKEEEFFKERVYSIYHFSNISEILSTSLRTRKMYLSSEYRASRVVKSLGAGQWT